MRLMRRISWRPNKSQQVKHLHLHSPEWYTPGWRSTYIVVLLRLLHDKLSYHRGVVFHQIGKNIRCCSTNLNIIHSLFHEQTFALSCAFTMYLNLRIFKLTSMTSRAGRMPMFDNVLKKASLFWGCNVCENAQNSFRKFTCKKTSTQLNQQWVMRRNQRRNQGKVDKGLNYQFMPFVIICSLIC